MFAFAMMGLLGLAVLAVTAVAVATRDSAIGVTVTGLMIGGAAYFWQEVLGFFAGLSRKLGDEAATQEKSEQPRRVA